jgi:hypothetical protein
MKLDRRSGQDCRVRRRHANRSYRWRYAAAHHNSVAGYARRVPRRTTKKQKAD